MKRILTMITAAALGLMAWTSHAAQAVATVTIGSETTRYTSWDALATAVSALGSGTTATVKMYSDITVTTNMTINGADVTLDLNGKTVTLSASGEGKTKDYFEILVYSGKLTINDSSESQAGCVKNDTENVEHGIFAYCTSSSGELVVNAGTFDVLVYGLGKNSKVTINGGKFCEYNEDDGKFLLAGYVPTGTSYSKVGDYWVVSGSTTPTGVATVKIGDTTTTCATWDDLTAKVDDLSSGTTAEVTILQSVELTSTLDAGSGVTVKLDLNGQTLTMKSFDKSEDTEYAASGAATQGAYEIGTTDGILIIDDSSADKSGRIVNGGGDNGDVIISIQYSSSKAIINAGTFDCLVESWNGGKIEINGGKFRATENGGTSAFSLENYVASNMMAEGQKIGDVDYWVIVVKPVAKIGTTGYATLQDAVDAAVKMTSTASKVAAIEIVSDITLTNTLTIAAEGTDSTTFVFTNTSHTVTFSGDAESSAILVDLAIVKFAGAGTWQRTAGTKPLIDIGTQSTCDGEDYTQMGLVYVYGGNFVNKGTGHVVNIANGGIVVEEDCTFEVAGASAACIHEEVPATGASVAAGIIQIKAGTFKGPTSGTAALISAESASPQVYLNVDGGINFVGSDKAIGSANEYLYKFEGNNATKTSDYEFQLQSGSADTYEIVKKATATVVAKIGEVEYTSLQDAVDAAVTNRDDTVIDVVSDITLNETLTIQGTSYLDKTLYLNNEKYTVSFEGGETSAGIMVDAMYLEVEGTGTWQRVKGSAPLFEIGSLSSDSFKKGLVAAVDGTFVNKGTGAVMNAVNGAIVAKRSTFEVADKNAQCIYVKAPAENGDDYSGYLTVVGGTVKGPADGEVALVSVEDMTLKAGGIYVLGATKLVGSAKAAELTSKYFITENGEKIVATSDYEFKLQSGSADTYEIVKKAAATVATVTIGTNVTECATWAEIAKAISTLTSNDTATITLEQPVTASSTVSIPKSSEVTFDLNGQTVSMAADIVMLEANKGSKLTVQDSDPEKKGRFAVASGVNYAATVLYVSGATLVATGGIYDGTFAEIKAAGGMTQTPSSATISGGSFIASKNTYDEGDKFLYEGYLAPGGAATKETVNGTDYWVVTSPVATVTVTPVGDTATTTSCKTWMEIVNALAGSDMRYVSVKLLQSVTADYVVGCGLQRILGFTFDLNGQTVSMTADGTKGVSGGKTIDYGAIIALYNCGTVTVTDTSAGKNGRFAVASGATYTGTIFDKDTGLAINAGIFDASLGGSSSVKISGGKFLVSENSDGDKFAFEAKLASGTEAKKEGVYWVVESVSLATVTIDGTDTPCATWADVQTAIAGATSATIKLNQDYAFDSTFTISSGAVTLDLNGKTLSTSTPFSGNVVVQSSGAGVSLTVTDSDTNKTGRIVASTKNAVGDSDSATLTIEGGIIDGSLSNNQASGGAIKIIGGSFLATDGAAGADSFHYAFMVDTASGVVAPKAKKKIDDSDNYYWVVEPPAPFKGTVTVGDVVQDITTWAGVQEIVTNATLGAISITLGEDLKMSESLYITNPNVTLDLMGKTLTLEAGVDIWVQNDANNNHGSLTITDSSTEQTGLIQKEGTSSDQGIWSQPNTKIVINAGKFDVKVDSIELSDRQKNITINGGSFSTEKFGDSSFNLEGCVNADATCKNVDNYWVVALPFATLTIDGEKVECSSWSELESKIGALKSGQTAEVKLNQAIELDDQFKVPTGADVTLDLNGQTLTTTKTSTQSYILTAYGTLTITDSSEAKTGCIALSDDSGDKLGISVDDGTLIIDEGIIDAYIGYYNDYKITLNGGSYDSAIYTETWIKNYAPAGSVVAKNKAEDHLVLTTPFATVTVNGVDTPCMSIADVNTAIDDRTPISATIKLGRSQTVDVTLRIGSRADVTLDLNGKTLTSSSSEISLIYVLGTLTITDTSTAKTGRIVAQKIATIYNDNSLLTIEAGTFDGAISHDKGTFVIRGGSFRAAENGGTETFTHKASIDTTAGVVVPTKTTKVDGVDYWVVAVPTVGGTVKIDGAETNITSWAELVTVVSNKTSGTVEIKLTEDTTLPKTLEINGASVTLDLNGQTLTLGDEAIIKVAGGTLTIDDSNTNKTGRVTFNETDTEADYEHGILAQSPGRLVINDGTYDAVVYGNPAEINGGKFIAKYNTDDGDEDEEEKYLLDGSVSDGHSAVKQTVEGVDYWVVVDFEIKKETATEAAAEYTYEMTADGTVKITGFVNPTLDGTTLVLPDMIDGKFVTEIADKAFMNASLGITSVKLPICCTKIGKKAFCLIKTLTSVTFVDVRDWRDLTKSAELTIGNYAFDATALTSVEIPSCVTKIGNFAFADCRKLASVTVAGSPTYGYRPFRRAGVDVGKTVDLTMTVAEFAVMSDTGKVQFTVAVDTADTSFPWGAVDVKTLKVEYAETLDGAKTALTPTLVSQGADGSATIEVTPPEGAASAFFWTTINTAD